MAWDWVMDTAKGLVAVFIIWLSNYLRKQSKPIWEGLKQLSNIVKDVRKLKYDSAVDKSKLLALIHISKNPFYIIDTKGLITDVNQAWVDLTGFKDDRDAYGTGYLRAVHPEDRAEIDRQRLMLSDTPTSFNGTVRFKNLKTGDVIICTCVSQTFQDENGKVVGTVGTLYLNP